ncbi:MAG: hypothetical protein ABH829_02600, partial [archaeon]
WTSQALKDTGVVLTVKIGSRGEVIMSVTNTKGEPLENVEVALITSTGAVIRASTNKFGEATVYEYPGDPLSVKVEAGGVEIATQRVSTPEEAAAEGIRAAEVSQRMGSWTVLIVVILLIPAIGFYVFSKKR